MFVTGGLRILGERGSIRDHKKGLHQRRDELVLWAPLLPPPPPLLPHYGYLGMIKLHYVSFFGVNLGG